MRAKITRIAQAICAILIIQLFCISCANISAQLEQAETLLKKNQYEQAEQIYRQIVADNPATDYAFQSQEKLTWLYIGWGKNAQAQTSLDKLLSDFSAHKDIAEALWRIAREFERRGNQTRAIQLHKYNVEHFPKDKYAMWSQVEIIYYHIREKDFTAADAACNKLLTVFAEQPTLPKEIYRVAMAFKRVGKADMALQLHQYNAKNFPSDQYAMWSQVEIVKSHLNTGKYAAADAACDKLIAVFSQQPNLPKEIYQIARRYSELRRYDKALSLDKHNAEHFPDDMYALLSKVYYHIRDADYEAADLVVDKLFAKFSEQPALARELYHLTEAFGKAGKYDKTVRLYQYFLDKQPGDEQAILAQQGLAIAYIELGDEAAAQAAIDKLLTDFSGHKRIAEAVYELGLYYYRAKKFDKAFQLHQYNVEHFSRDDKHTIWSQVEVIKSYIRDGNQQAADAAYEKLLSVFSSRPTLATEISRVADTYIAAGKLDKAERLYKYVLDKWPGDKQILWATAGMIKLDIARGNEAAAQKAIDNLIADFKDHPTLPQAIFSIGEQYWIQALSYDRAGVSDKANEYYRKALAVWERIIKDLPPSIITAQAYHMAGECYRYFGQNEKAIEYYKTVVDKWPDYQYAWLTQNRIAKIYRWLVATGVMSEPEGQDAIKVAYERLLTSYPDCPVAQVARDWLNDYYRENRGQKK